LLDILDEKKKS